MKKVFKLDAAKVAAMSTVDILAAIGLRGHLGHFVHLDTLSAMKGELRKRVDAALVEHGATVLEAEPVASDPDWGYPSNVK